MSSRPGVRSNPTRADEPRPARSAPPTTTSRTTLNRDLRGACPRRERPFLSGDHQKTVLSQRPRTRRPRAERRRGPAILARTGRPGRSVSPGLGRTRAPRIAAASLRDGGRPSPRPPSEAGRRRRCDVPDRPLDRPERLLSDVGGDGGSGSRSSWSLSETGTPRRVARQSPTSRRGVPAVTKRFSRSSTRGVRTRPESGLRTSSFTTGPGALEAGRGRLGLRSPR